MQETGSLHSRRKCVACLCATLAAVNIAGPLLAPDGFALESMDSKLKSVCRNCSGSGVVLCKISSFLCALLLVFILSGMNGVELDQLI